MTHFDGPRFGSWDWLHTNRHVVFSRDKGGNQAWHWFALDVATCGTKDLTPVEGVHATLAATSARDPRHVVVGMNDRDRKFQDLYRVDIDTGERRLLARNDLGFVWWGVGP